MLVSPSAVVPVALQAQAPRVARACKQLLRLIQARALCVGERLPSQQELRRLLNSSNNTLNAAMRFLIRAGIVERRERIGTTVMDLGPLSRAGWTVGIVNYGAPDCGPGAFFSDLLHRLLFRLHRAHCECRAYFPVDGDRCQRRYYKLDDFPGLGADVREGRLDGLVFLTNLNLKDWRELQKKGIAVCHTGIWKELPCAVLVDRDSMVREAAEWLARQGCSRLMLVDTMGTEGDDNPRSVVMQESFAASGGDPAKCETALVKPGRVAGHQLAASLLANARARRPDALIVVDDYVAMGLSHALAKAGGYCPTIVALTNRQLPLHFGLPVFRFEMDSDELAQAALAMLQARLLQPSLANSLVEIRPRAFLPTSSPPACGDRPEKNGLNSRTTVNIDPEGHYA